MQTLTQNTLEFSQVHSTEYRIIADGQNLGMISFNIAAMRWEYTPYSQPVRAVGTLEECKAAAQSDHDAQNCHATVTHVDTDIQPAYKHRNTSWRVSGPGYEQTVTVQQGNDTYQVLVARSFARSLNVGSVVELHQDQIQGLFLRWTRKPVRRTAIAA